MWKKESIRDTNYEKNLMQILETNSLINQTKKSRLKVSLVEKIKQKKYCYGLKTVLMH
jgi:hypothetical protein